MNIIAEWPIELALLCCLILLAGKCAVASMADAAGGRSKAALDKEPNDQID